MKTVGIIAWVLLIIGGLNWGLVGLFHFNLVDTIFGVGSIIASIIYILVGISALVAIVHCCKCCCKDKSCKM